ncbi:hypothetical protein [Arthrobacter sp. H5]|uniref:hypothetical protein n=1 Tax=Arthrobacter sp. H5 TaxID=1267973 RepID=UPI00138AF493|nr:hypothetical protein [Arthrobacter sp. H5]
MTTYVEIVTVVDYNGQRLLGSERALDGCLHEQPTNTTFAPRLRARGERNEYFTHRRS